MTCVFVSFGALTFSIRHGKLKTILRLGTANNAYMQEAEQDAADKGRGRRNSCHSQKVHIRIYELSVCRGDAKMTEDKYANTAVNIDFLRQKVSCS